MYLNNLKDNAGATKVRKRVGRGIASGLGKTAGRGHKGQKSRSGVAIKGFEGGQMPIYRRLPKHGFTNIFRVEYQALNLGRLQTLIDNKKLDPSETITPDALVKAGAVKRIKDGIKLLGVGELTSKIDLEIHAISASAEKAVVAAGGQVRVLVEKKEKAEVEAS